jgi:hypothetical protein
MEPESYAMRMFLSQNKEELQRANMLDALSSYVAEDEARERADSEDTSELSTFLGIDA